MKYHILIILIFLIVTSGFAQNKRTEFNRSLKLYNLSTYQKTRVSSFDSVSTTNSYSSEFQILHPTIAYTWKDRKFNFNEVELTALVLKKNTDETTINNNGYPGPSPPVSGASVISSTVSLRYEYIINFFKASIRKLVPSLGFSVNPYYNQTHLKPHTSQSFPKSVVNIGMKGFVVPRITYYCSSRCFIDINIPVTFFDAKNTFSTVRNPQIPVESQRTSKGDFSLFPKQFSLRLGIGVKI